MEQTNIDANLISPNSNQGKQQLPNATATLVLGILSIVMCICYGIPSLALGIIALAISSKSVKLYNENPDIYEGYNNLKSGRTMAIIGLSLSGVFIIFWVIYFIIIGSLITNGLFDNF
jgi:M penetrans paralogue family 26